MLTVESKSSFLRQGVMNPAEIEGGIDRGSGILLGGSSALRGHRLVFYRHLVSTELPPRTSGYDVEVWTRNALGSTS